MGAVDYDSEVTCIIIADAANKADFLNAPLPDGAFFNEQGSKALPRFHKQKEEETSEQYFERMKKVATSCKGKLVYRPSANASIGVKLVRTTLKRFHF